MLRNKMAAYQLLALPLCLFTFTCGKITWERKWCDFFYEESQICRVRWEGLQFFIAEFIVNSFVDKIFLSFVDLLTWVCFLRQLNIGLQVKQQHLDRNVAFLVDELKVVQSHEAQNRVFFVSAREALVSRVNQDRGTPTPSGQLLEGFQGRIFEFANFERKFEVNLLRNCNARCFITVSK